MANKKKGWYIKGKKRYYYNGKRNLTEAFCRNSADNYADETDMTRQAAFNKLFPGYSNPIREKTTKQNTKSKVEIANFYKGNYSTYAKDKKEADNRIDNLQMRTQKVNFTPPKRIKSKTVRITPKQPKIR